MFFGAVSLTSLLALLMEGAAVGAAVGAAAGVFIAWLRLDYNSFLWLSITAGVLLLAGVGGAWGGFEYGAAREVHGCAAPDITPITYVALGATAAGLMLGIAPPVVTTLRRRTQPEQFR